ncbi:hypothetical protein [Bradyrhizobium sp. BR13661]|jgi:hypothetical protein|uniref:hypothetical protein n=1 Tax=Bradyrhizobium sp. BR13661 TaxID=2940622 RepID=UPI002473DC73|nr:hypothetical protein [Bradyrhizobium sp. BR13661]MDH6259574.1 hypothetical protein [Bradyrhizobium sp. BR13661]
MPETVDVLLWCAALATWLMMFFKIASESVKKLVLFVRGRANKPRRTPPDRHQNAER